MPLDDSDADDSSRIKRSQRPSIEQLQKLLETPARESFPLVSAFLLVPENPSRVVYTALRQIYLPMVQEFWDKLLASADQPATEEETSRLLNEWMIAQKKMEEVQLWFRPASKPLSLETALRFIEGSKSRFWRESVMKQVGKRRGPGQPATKRYLALQALDLKCAYPETSLREATNMLCPCGLETHTDKCREQLRQQILRLVKFLRQYGHDFQWENIQARGGCKELS